VVPDCPALPASLRSAALLLPFPCELGGGSFLAAVVADGELLHLTMASGERFTITYRIKHLERRLDPARFVRMSRGTLASVDLIQRISPMPGGTYVVTLRNNLQLPVSRLRARALRDELLRL
jgi:DNA-binding LytR/AlgR family response regulator